MREHKLSINEPRNKQMRIETRRKHENKIRCMHQRKPFHDKITHNILKRQLDDDVRFRKEIEHFLQHSGFGEFLTTRSGFDQYQKPNERFDEFETEIGERVGENNQHPTRKHRLNKIKNKNKKPV